MIIKEFQNAPNRLAITAGFLTGGGKLCLRFVEQLDQASARFSRVTSKLQEFPVMPDMEADDLRIFRR